MDFLLVLSICLVVVLNDWGQWAVCERKGNDAYNHDNCAEYPFEVVGAPDVSVANGSDGRYRPVKGKRINASIRPILIFKAFEPCSNISLVVDQACRDDPQARCNMAEYKEDQNEEKEAFEAHAKFEQVVEVLHKFWTLFHHFEDSQQARKFNELVQSAKSCNSYKSVQMVWSSIAVVDRTIWAQLAYNDIKR